MNARAYQHLIAPLVSHRETIEHAFDIPSIKVLPTNVKSLNLRLEEGQDELGTLTFHLTYRELSKLEYEAWKLIDLPEDIEREIYSYFKKTLELRFQIDFRNRWPFRSPRVSILSLTVSDSKLKELVHRFNCDLQAEWSPALGFDKTLLMLLVRILEQLQYV